MARRQPNLEEALNATKNFVSDLQSSLDLPQARSSYGSLGLTFSSRDDGSFSLDRAESRRCSRTISMLATALHNRFHRTAIRDVVYHFILEVFDPKGRSTLPPVDRLKAGIRQLRELFTTEPKAWVTLLNVSGLEPLSRPIVTPDVEICSPTSSTIVDLFSAFDRITDSTTSSPSDKEAIKADRHTSFAEHFGDRPVAVVRTSACEAGSAIAQAASTLDRSLSRINFLLDAIDQGETILRSERDVWSNEFTLCLDITEERRAHQGHRIRPRTRPIAADRFAELMSDGPAKLTWQLICTPNPNEFQQRMLMAIQWGGSAASDSDPAQAFLKRMIALESLLIGGLSRSDLQLRSQLFTVYILGNRVRSRKQVYEDIGHLYDVRSKIVHDGQIDVRPVDSALLREYLLQVLLVLVEDEPFTLMTDRSAFDEWLKARARGDDPSGEQSQAIPVIDPVH